MTLNGRVIPANKTLDLHKLKNFFMTSCRRPGQVIRIDHAAVGHRGEWMRVDFYSMKGRKGTAEANLTNQGGLYLQGSNVVSLSTLKLYYTELVKLLRSNLWHLEPDKE